MQITLLTLKTKDMKVFLKFKSALSAGNGKAICLLAGFVVAGMIGGFVTMCLTNNAFWFFGQLPLYMGVISGVDSQKSN